MLSRRLCLLFCCIALASLAHGAPTRLEPPRTTSLPPSTARVQHTGPWVASPRGGAKVVPPAATPSWKADLLHRAKVGFYFGLWYALNIVYNIVNKKVLNVWPAPMTVGSLQLGIGAAYAWLVWTLGLRPRPFAGAIELTLRRVGLWHALGQLCTMMSLGAGPVSFTHIVKALEPFFSAMVSALLLGQWMPIPVYLTLLPVVGGVGYACLKERSFSWLAFGMAMLSNLSFALRAVLSKVAMTTAAQSTATPTRQGQKDHGDTAAVANLTPPNVFGLVTIAAFFLSIPLVILGEGLTVQDTLASALEQQDAATLARSVLLSGLFHYLNNEVMYLALGSVHPITLAVGNTMKRVFIMVASVMVFRNVITTQAAVGSTIGIGGVLLYSLTKQHYEKKGQEDNTNDKKKKKLR